MRYERGMETQGTRTRRAEWQKRIERWRDSGLTAEQFAAELGINAGTLKFWKYRIGKDAAVGVRREADADGAEDPASRIARRGSRGDHGRVVTVRAGVGQRSSLADPVAVRRFGSRAIAFGPGARMIPGGVRIFVCTAPVDLRHGFDRLAQTARERVGTDPMSGGALFVFANKRATRLKVLWFERNGMCLLYKRLHQAAFDLPVCGWRLGVGAHRRQLRLHGCSPASQKTSCEKESVRHAHALLDSDHQILHSCSS